MDLCMSSSEPANEPRANHHQRVIQLEKVDELEILQEHRALRWYFRARRCADILIVICGLPVVAMTLLVCAVLILVTMGRPILFRQKRVGSDGRVFRMYKLRTM